MPPLPDLAVCRDSLKQADIPVPAAAAAALERLREAEQAREGSVDANRIGETLGRDPLMTLRVLVHSARRRPPGRLGDPQTVTAAVVMMGIPPFFREFGAQPTVEQRLAGRPQALACLGAALARADRAASLALAFAAQRGDADAGLIHQAALLHDFAGLLLWCHAPELALAVERQRDAERAAALAARELADGCIAPGPLAELQWSLADAWRLPVLLRRPQRERDALRPRSRCVALAVRLCWGDDGGEAAAGALAEVASLLALPVDDARRFVAEAVADREAGAGGTAACGMAGDAAAPGAGPAAG